MAVDLDSHLHLQASVMEATVIPVIPIIHLVVAEILVGVLIGDLLGPALVLGVVLADSGLVLLREVY